MSNKIRVLIVDDSLIFRQAISLALKDAKDIVVSGSVSDGLKAIDFIKVSRPDLVTLDIEMPNMDGIATLQAIQNFNTSTPTLPPIGVIMVSSHTKKGADITIKALELGAFDFITKPVGLNEKDSTDSLSRSLLPKIYHYSSVITLKAHKPIVPTNTTIANTTTIKQKIDNIIEKTNALPHNNKFKVVVIGVSTGGPKALSDLLPSLCEKLTVPILIVQHMPESFTKSLAESLDKKCYYKVKEAEEGEIIKNLTIYIAKGGSHMVVKKNENSEDFIMFNQDPPENGCRPAVDVLYRSLPNVYGSKIVSIMLTGMGSDGTIGLKSLKKYNAYSIAQDESSSVVWGMPGSAVAANLVDEVLPLTKIAAFVHKLFNV